MNHEYQPTKEAETREKRYAARGSEGGVQGKRERERERERERAGQAVTQCGLRDSLQQHPRTVPAAHVLTDRPQDPLLLLSRTHTTRYSGATYLARAAGEVTREILIWGNR